MKVFKIIIVTLITCLFGLSLSVEAAQFDAPYYDLQKKNQDKWAAEDKQIDAKLAALKKKFGKKPNIIYILADDIGFGELGWQGGGQAPRRPVAFAGQDGLRGHALPLVLLRAVLHTQPHCNQYGAAPGAHRPDLRAVARSGGRAFG